MKTAEEYTQALGFDISYRHLANSQQEIKFTKKETGVNQGMEMAFTKVLPSKEVLNALFFCQHLELIYNYLKSKTDE